MNTSTNNTIYVDCDGVLLCGSHDDLFMHKCKTEEFSDVLAWYNTTYVDDLSVNIDLIKDLLVLKDKGFNLVLWTNRGPAQYEMTKSNLGIWWSIFNNHMFLDGGKRKLDSVDAFIIEDSHKNAQLSTIGYTLVNYRTNTANKEAR